MKQAVKYQLSRLSKALKVDISYVAKNTFWLNASSVISSIFTLILGVAMANILSQETFGNYRYVLALTAIISAFCLSGLNLAVVRDVAKGVTGLVREGFYIQLKWGVFPFIISLVLCAYYLFRGNQDLGFSILLIGIFIPILSSTHIYSSFLEGKRDYRRVGLYTIITTVIYTGSLFFVINHSSYLPLIILTYFASQAACSSFFYRTTSRRDVGTPEHTAATFSLGKHLSAMNVLSAVAGQLDKLLIFQHLGAAQLAIYAVSQIPVANIRAVFKQMAQVSYPKYSSKSIVEIHASIYHKMTLFSIPIAIVVVAYIVMAQYIFNLFFPKYIEAVLYSQITILSLLFFQKKLIAYAILAVAEKRDMYVMSIWSSVFKVALLVIFLPLYGIWGAIYAEIIAQISGLISSILMFRRMVQKKKGVS